MPMRDYEDLKNLKIPAEQERIMDIICDAWEECRATDCQSECKDNQVLPCERTLFACTALKYSRKIHEAGYAPVKWIDVNDRLPTDLKPVNIVWKNMDPAPYYADIKGKSFVAAAYYFNGKWWWFSSTCDDYLELYGRSDADEVDEGIVITHWMPLPEPPEAEKWKNREENGL